MSMFEGVSLPQHTRNHGERQERLVSFREKFRYDQSVVQYVPISASVPEEAKAGPGWSLKLVATAYKLRRNWEKILDEEGYVFQGKLDEKSIPEIAQMLLKKDLVGILGYSDPDLGVALDHKRPQTFTEYYKLFKHFAVPEGADQLMNESEFADYFVAGLNPLVIRTMTEIPAKLNLTQDLFAAHPAFRQDQLQDALGEGRLFIVDYEILTGLEPGVHPDQPKFIYAPIVMLALPRGSQNLEVIGIQTGQDKNQYPVVTQRSGSWDWLIAKTMVKTADINYHEVASHLGLTHLVIDPIVVATYRQLSDKHPLHQLLTPHFEGTIPINTLAVRRLINRDGKVEQLLAPQIESAYKVLSQIRNGFHFRNAFLPNDLVRRGVDVGGPLKNYPYRDDALLIWTAIENWVRDYVNTYYMNDADVEGDTELAQWTAEIIDPACGRIQGFAPNDRINTRQVLTETLTMIIFTASAQHAAVNFPQGRAAAVPYQPLAGYAPALTQLGLTEKEAVEFLPPLDRAIKQTHTLKLLGDTYYTQLGGYAIGTFDDKRILPAMWKFQDRLRHVESEINHRNRSRRTSYPYLKPSLIPQSINI
ncbi:MAG TPA: lipoxygenase family protein [Oligoflexus sp.]|uniref:lipoxygenase family protein n=1 Tax=Oligoflexus sp. TaxID=1971216 RepID=UPI002D35E2B0|nr:lipoxygenase family protein [Oligoflexus sp.]HYX37556.1 lipoxygenase family protein [Oligoflexus sp.]